MKKFLVIALTVLMAFGFVSCSGETSATDHAKLTTEAKVVADIPQSKALVTIQGDDIEIRAIKVTIMPTWTAAGSYVDYGNLTGTDANGFHTVTKALDNPDLNNIDINLGYISQGEWTIKVEAYAELTPEGEGAKKVFEGETTCYITNASPTAEVTLWECKEGTGSLILNIITTPKYADDSTGYKMVVTIDGEECGDYKPAPDTYGNWVWMSPEDLTLASGSHTYIIQLKEGSEVVAGVAGTFFLEPEGEAVLSGELFKSADIRPTATIPVETYTVTLSGPEYFHPAYGATYFEAYADNTLGDAIDSDSYVWYIDGMLQMGSGNSFDISSVELAPGHHTVSVIYKNASATKYVQVAWDNGDL